MHPPRPAAPEPTPSARAARRRVPAAWGSAAGLALLTGVVAVTVHAGVPNEARWRLLALIGACWAVFALAAAAVLRTPPRVAVPLIVFGAVVLQAVAVSVPPQMTDDFYRYAWDGRVQAAGIDPYRYAPVDPALAPLRDDWLFPPGCRSSMRVPCTRMNHPGVPTIYPPVAQLWFHLVHALGSLLGAGDDRTFALQLASAVLALATTGLLLLVLRRRGLDPRRAVLWAWCPLVGLEAGNNAHVDVLAAFLVALAALALASGRAGRAGLAVGAAIGAKLLPVLLVPALLAPVGGRGRRWWAPSAVRLVLAAVAVLALVYLPYVLAAGPRVLGFLPGYLQEEGYGGARRFALLRTVLPAPAATAVAAAVLAAAALRTSRHADPRHPWPAAAAFTGLTLALGGVTYPWYALLLVTLVALGGGVAWLAVAVAAYPGYFTDALHLPYTATQATCSAAALATVAAWTWSSNRRARGTAEGNRQPDRRATGTGLRTGGGPPTRRAAGPRTGIRRQC